VDDDHLDHYGNLSSLHDAFGRFASSVKNPDHRILCADCPDLYALARKRFGQDFVSYGFSEWSDIRAVEVHLDKNGSDCRVLYRGGPLGRIRLRVPGRHMLSNALSVYSAAVVLGFPLEKVAYGLSEFRGARRRFEVLGTWNGATLIDDYAHHPTEIRATLQTLNQVTEGRCVVVFQPHRYSRTDQLFDRFAETFVGVDLLVLTEIYSAGEKPRPGVSSKHLMASIRGVQESLYAPTLDDAEELLRQRIGEGDTVLFLGAGNINEVAFRLLGREG